MKLKKPTKILLVSAAVYPPLLYYTQGTWDWASALIYAGLALTVGLISEKSRKRWDIKRMFFLGIGISAIYNIGGSMLGWFDFNLSSTFMSALQQGGITALTFAIMRGGKK